MKRNLKFVRKYFKPYKNILFICSIIIFISNLNYIFTGYLIGVAIESVIQKDIKIALIYLLTYFTLNIVINFISRIIYFLLSKVQIKISRRIGFDTYQKTMSLPASAFEEMSSGEIINRITGDTEVIIGSVDSLISILSNVISSIIILIYIFFNSWIIGLEIVLFLIIYVFIVKYFTKKLKQYHKETKKHNDEFTALTNESIRGIREVKTLGIVKSLYQNVEKIIRNLYHVTLKEYKTSRNYDLISDFLKTLLECGVFITCAILTYKDMITITFFVAMTYYIYRFTWIVENVTSFSKTYEKLSVSMGRIHEIVSNQLYEDVTYGNEELQNSKGILEFRNVTFHYKNEEALFNKLNITFEPNKKIAIVGPSGEGKSTLFNLITRIFDPIDGGIYLDGVNIKDLTEESLRENISIIRQEPFIFNRTIKENFLLIHPFIELEEIRKYCKLAYIDDYIMSLPNKYDTVLGEGGVNLSGGQKQRLSIARTLLKKSKVILFDEVTSALDNESQQYIKNTIDQLAKNHTVLIVAHRLSTIMDADIIYVIKNGEVYAIGTHAELMKKNKFYQNLYQAESRSI